MNEWTLALSDKLIGESFFQLKFLLVNELALNKLLARTVSFIDAEQAVKAINRALHVKASRE